MKKVMSVNSFVNNYPCDKGKNVVNRGDKISGQTQDFRFILNEAM